MEVGPATIPGERFGRYLLLEFIGRGGMAEVYRAVSHGLNGFQRVFVIKRILREKSASREFVEMFINEARISAILNHPNIVQIYDFGQIDGSYFLAMEYLRGKDLLTLLRALKARNRAMPVQVAAYVAQQVAIGLHHAHSLTQGGRPLGIVHRDVSPSNVMLQRAGGVKLLDFGIAKAAMEIRTDVTTEVGLVKGKLSYVSPEQIRNGEIDGRSDVFALGVMLWECLTGKRLFYDKSDYQTMRNVLERPVAPPSLQRMDVPAPLDYIVIRALERDPSRRYSSAKMMADEIEAYLRDTRFAPSGMTQLLDELFGEDMHQAEAQIPADAFSSASGPLDSDARGVSLSSASSLSPAPPFSEVEGYTGVSSVHRLTEHRRIGRRVPMLATAAAGLALAAGLTAWRVSSPQDSGRGALAPRAASPALGYSASALGEKELAGAVTRETVEIRVQSEPHGAEVRNVDGDLLGVTPTVLKIPRAEQPVIMTLSKPGFLPSHHALVPDRDVSALVSLRHEVPPARSRAAVGPAHPRPRSRSAPSGQAQTRGRSSGQR